MAAGAGAGFGEDDVRRWRVAHASWRLLPGRAQPDDKLNYSTAETVLLVVAVNLVMLVLLEVPLLCFAIAPSWTVGAIDRAKASIGRRGRRFAVTMLAVLGGLLVIKGLIELLS